MSFAKRLIPPPVVNRIIPADGNSKNSTIVIATGNQKKLEEFRRIFKDYDVIGKKLDLPEIQSEDHEQVLEQKARDAWKLNDGRPILVEDSALSLASLDNLPGPFADQFTNSRGKRKTLCDAISGKDRSAYFQVGLGLFDGIEVHTWIGRINGKIAEEPRGADNFGFDDIFIPEGQDGAEKTYSQMSESDKDLLSPRRLALEAFLNSPAEISTPVFGLPDPMQMQKRAVKHDVITDPNTLAVAYAVETITDNKPKSDFSISKRSAYIEHDLSGGEVKQIIPENSSSIGLIRTPMDTWVGVEGASRRLLSDEFGNIRLWQMSDSEISMALAGRAYEFTLHHNSDIYALLRKMMSGELKTSKRPNKRSLAIEKMLDIVHKEELDHIDDEIAVLGTAATREIGYSRISSDKKMSRTGSANTGLILTTAGFPSSLFALGGMPPVTGWRDVLVTSAMSYMRSYIPRNSIFAGSLKRQLDLFTASADLIRSFNLPEDIEALVLKQIGISVGCENPQNIVEDLKKMHNVGCTSVRIYTTNPDIRIIETAEAIRQAFGEEMTLCVGPIVDKKQADLLIGSNIKSNVLLAGHGGGENCTSLEGGGTANALEILYFMYLDPAFNETAIGLEGGTGNSFGALLGMLDVISLNRRGVKGGIETGGMYFEHSDGSIVQPYSGSASAITQWIEAVMADDIAARRLNPAGSLRNVEGKPNYMRKGRYIHSITDNFREQRMLAGRALADQEAHSISELRENISRLGYIANHRYVSSTAAEIASAHRTQV
jgi:XTP/dITP diphosphohydrolase